MKQYSLFTAVFLLLTGGAYAAELQGYLESTHHHVTLTAAVPDNGDQNPYAIVVDYNPTTKQMSLFAQIPKDLKGCPGGVGLTTAMTMLKSGWVIVGSTPSTDGTTATKGDGCLIVLDSHGKVAGTIAGAKINDPWGNMAVVDSGSSATLFVSMTGFGVGAPSSARTIVNKATVLRIELSIPEGKPPVVKSQTVIADGLSERADKEVFIIGPTGLALGKDNSTLYVSDALNNRVIAIDKATTRKESAGGGREVTKDGLLHRPLAMILAPNGNLLVTNGKNGQIVEIDPASGKQIYAQWVDANKAQTPPGSGDLFGIALTPDGKGFYYVEDENNALVLAE